MKSKYPINIAAALLSAVAFSSFASNCTILNYQNGDVVDVKSSFNLGSRIQLPSKLIRLPVVTNARKWNVGGDIGSNQIVIAPDSLDKDAGTVMVFAFTEDGKVYDIKAKRVPEKEHQACVIVDKRPRFFYAPAVELKAQPKVVKLDTPPPPLVKTPAKVMPELEKEDKFKSVIFTRYDWNEAIRFVGNNYLSDVYDDGRKTFIRLAKENQGILTVSAHVNGRNVEIPVREVEPQLLAVNGVYSSFVVHAGNTKIPVTR